MPQHTPEAQAATAALATNQAQPGTAAPGVAQPAVAATGTAQPIQSLAILDQLTLSNKKTKDLMRLLTRAGVDLTLPPDQLIAQLEIAATPGSGNRFGQDKLNKVINLLNSGGFFRPGGAGGTPTFQDPQLSSVRIALGQDDPTLPGVVQQAQDIQNFMAQQRAQTIQQLPGQPQLVSPFAQAAPGQQQQFNIQGLLANAPKPQTGLI